MAVAMRRNGLNCSRSYRMPSGTDPPSRAGCRRRVSEKRLIRTSSVASKNRTSTVCPWARSSCTICSGPFRKSRPRISLTRATSRIRSVDFFTSSTKVANNATGRLSRQKNPSSSSALTAVDLPEPERPVMMTILSLLNLIPQRPHIQPCHQPLVEIPGRMVAHPLEQVVARSHFDNGGQVTAGTDRNLQVRQIDPEDGVNPVVNTEPFVLLFGIPFHQFQNHVDDLFLPD